MHPSAYQWYVDRAAQLPHLRSIVEIGGRNINGSVRQLFSADSYLSLDLHDGPGVDVVADACEWAPLTTPDLVICSQVLEHAPQAAEMVARAHSWLAPGGVLLIATVGGAWPPHSAIDGGPVRPGEFYRGVSTSDLAEWLSPFGHYTCRSYESGDRFAIGIKAGGPRDAKSFMESLWPVEALWPIEVPA